MPESFFIGFSIPKIDAKSLHRGAFCQFLGSVKSTGKETLKRTSVHCSEHKKEEALGSDFSPFFRRLESKKGKNFRRFW